MPVTSDPNELLTEVIDRLEVGDDIPAEVAGDLAGVLRAALAARSQPDLRPIRQGVIDGVKSHLNYNELPCPPDIDPLVDRIMTCIAVAVAGSATPTQAAKDRDSYDRFR